MGPGNLWYSIKIFFPFFFPSRQPGEHGKGRLKKKQERKINLQSSGTSQISVTLHRWFQAPIPKCTGLSVCQAAWACQRNSSLASACPRSRSFSLKWQQWAYPVQGQCWSSWDVGCYSKTCKLDWVQRAAGWELEPSDYNNWSRIHSHNSCSGVSCWRARRRCHTHSSGQPGGQGANASSPRPRSPR